MQKIRSICACNKLHRYTGSIIQLLLQPAAKAYLHQVIGQSRNRINQQDNTKREHAGIQKTITAYQVIMYLKQKGMYQVYRVRHIAQFV